MIVCRVLKSLSRKEKEDVLVAAGFNLRNVFSKYTEGEYIICSQKKDLSNYSQLFLQQPVLEVADLVDDLVIKPPKRKKYVKEDFEVL